MENVIDTNLGEVETKFAELVWEHVPVKTTDLIQLCSEQLGWKRTTTYTVLKKFCNKKIFSVENRIVTALVTKEEFCGRKSEKFIEDTFNGSLSAFLSAFASVRQMSEQEIEEIKKLIDEF